MTLVGKKKPLPVKIEEESHSFHISESEYDSQIAVTHQFTGEGTKFKNHVCNKVLYWCLITVVGVTQWTVSVNTVS
jgi:hypothetical protein